MTASGEGPTLGERCAFLRLGGCNLHCSWCDTGYTWDASRFDLREELTRIPADEITAQLLAMDVDFVIISGGEPLLQQHYEGWKRVLADLVHAGVRIEVETNGTIMPTAFTASRVFRFMISPKLAHSGDSEDLRLRPQVLRALAQMRSAVFKFVCTDAADVTEVERIAKRYGLDARRVWIMPLGITSTELCDHLAVIADPAIAAGFNLTTRLHIHTWGEVRGR